MIPKQKLAEVVSAVIPNWGPDNSPWKPFQEQFANQHRNHVNGRLPQDDRVEFSRFRPGLGPGTHTQHSLRSRRALQD